MAFSNTEMAMLRSKISAHLEKTGKVNGMVMPPSANNTESYAWDYFIGHYIASWGEAAKTKAVEAAIKNGVLFDHKLKPMPEGTNSTIYSGDNVAITLVVKKGTVKVDYKTVLAELAIKYSIPTSVLNAVVEAHSKQQNGAHTFTPSLVSK